MQTSSPITANSVLFSGFAVAITRNQRANSKTVARRERTLRPIASDLTQMSLPGPTIADDTLHYTIHAREEPAVIVAQIQTHIEGLLPKHIWHKDSLQLATDGKQPFIEGTMRVGDCIDDEWLVVWLLWEISGKWDVAIRSVSVLLPF